MTQDINELLKTIASTKTDEDLFNPYNQICNIEDMRTSPGLRQRNLITYLESYLLAKVDSIWLYSFVDLDSCKKTGIPKVTAAIFKKVEQTLNLRLPIEVATRNSREIKQQGTYNSVWDQVLEYSRHPLIWNILPFYPHKKENILLSREPGDAEYKKYQEFLKITIEIFKPIKFIAMDSNTEKTLKMLGYKSVLNVNKI